jgi:hypothetical protein
MSRGGAKAVVWWLFGVAELNSCGYLGGCLEWVLVGGGAESGG